MASACDIGYNIQYILPALPRKMQSQRYSLDKMDSLSPTCCSLEESLLTLDASITSFKDFSISETNDSALSLSKIITDSEEDAEVGEGDEEERCDDFHTLGYCLRGSSCRFEHRTSRGQTSGLYSGRTASSMLINFPEMIIAGSLRRTRSFLE